MSSTRWARTGSRSRRGRPRSSNPTARVSIRWSAVSRLPSGRWRSEASGVTPVKRTVIKLAKDASRGIDALKGTGVPAVFSDAVRIDLGPCALLFISGVVGTDESGKVVGRTMKEQTRQVLEKIKIVLAREGGTFDHIV